MIKPDYPNGPDSVVRENLILAGIQLEEVGTVAMARSNAMNTILASHYDRKKISTVLQEASSMAKYAAKRMFMDISRYVSPKELEEASIAASVAYFQKLKESGELARIKKAIQDKKDSRKSKKK